jgi:acyl carrier protein
MPREALLADTPFFELGCDSLDVLEISFLMEKELDLDLEGKVTGRNLPRHLSDLTKLLQAEMARQARGAAEVPAR